MCGRCEVFCYGNAVFRLVRFSFHPVSETLSIIVCLAKMRRVRLGKGWKGFGPASRDFATPYEATTFPVHVGRPFLDARTGQERTRGGTAPVAGLGYHAVGRRCRADHEKGGRRLGARTGCHTRGRRGGGIRMTRHAIRAIYEAEVG